MLIEKKLFKNSQGQTIIEAVVALSTILIIVAAIATVVVGGLYNSQFIKSQNLANKYAQQGMEIVKNYAQNNLANFSSLSSGPYFITSNSTLIPCSDPSAVCSGVNIGNSFERAITIDNASSNCASNSTSVTVSVSWSSTKCPSKNSFCHASTLISCVTNHLLNSSP